MAYTVKVWSPFSGCPHLYANSAEKVARVRAPGGNGESNHPVLPHPRKCRRTTAPSRCHPMFVIRPHLFPCVHHDGKNSPILRTGKSGRKLVELQRRPPRLQWHAVLYYLKVVLIRL